MDTMTFTKAAAGVLGAFLIFLLGNWASEVLYAVEGEGEPAYEIEVAEDEGGGAEEAEVSFEELLAAADIGKGAKVFKKCAACHKLEDGANGTGPFLYGVVGRAVASVGGFGYSAALTELGGDWTPERLDGFLTKPGSYAKGTTMGFAGLGKQGDRVNLIAYLDSLDD